jgi:CheY-like chemotaxis protein
LRKTALIVDDSKSATVVLKRMLESHDLEVDTAESAEAALEYLIDHRPDVVFMDHLMPGMDGFEAVTAIKNNPDTATIPIMMYTSQEGELYVGQARALGAIGVLPKQVQPVEVSKVLRSLRVIGDETERRKSADSATSDAASTESSGIERLDKDLRVLIQDLFEQQRAVIRRDLLDSYEVIASRVADEIRPPPPEAEELPDLGTARQTDAPARLKAAVALLSMLVIAFAWLYWMREQGWRDLQQENALLRSEIDQGNSSYAENAADIQRRLDDYQETAATAYSAALDAIEWGINLAGNYEFGDLPFGDRRLEMFDDMSERLLDIGFTGLVRAESHVGDFCVLAVGPGTYALPPPDLEAAACDVIGHDGNEALELGVRQSVAFANFLSASAARTQGRIRFEIGSLGNSDPSVPYPNSVAGMSAADWNRIAALNNRVLVSIFPDSSGGR